MYRIVSGFIALKVILKSKKYYTKRVADNGGFIYLENDKVIGWPEGYGYYGFNLPYTDQNFEVLRRLCSQMCKRGFYCFYFHGKKAVFVHQDAVTNMEKLRQKRKEKQAFDELYNEFLESDNSHKE